MELTAKTYDDFQICFTANARENSLRVVGSWNLMAGRTTVQDAIDFQQSEQNQDTEKLEAKLYAGEFWTKKEMFDWAVDLEISKHKLENMWNIWEETPESEPDRQPYE